MGETSSFNKLSAALCIVIVVMCLVAGVSLSANWNSGTACALALLVALVLTLPAITRSVQREGDGKSVFVLMGLGVLGYAGIAVLAVLDSNNPYLMLSFSMIGVFYLFLSLKALLSHAWPIPVACVGLITAALCVMVNITNDNDALYLLLFVPLPLFYFLLAIRLWSGATHYTGQFYRVVAKVSAVLAVILLIAWAYLDWTGARLRQSEIDRIKSTGAMTSIDEVLALATPADQDPSGKRVVDFFFSLTAENQSLTGGISVGKTEIFGSGFQSNIEDIAGQWSPEIAAGVKEACDKNRAVIDQALAISQLPPANLGTWIDAQKAKNLAAFKLPSLAYLKGTANLLALRGLLAAKEGRPDETLQCAGAILGLANHLCDSWDTLITEMIAAAMRNIATNTVRMASKDASFSDVVIGAFNEKIAQSLRPDGLAKSMENERLFALDVNRMLEAGQNLFSGSNGSLESIYGLRVFRFLRDRDQVCALHLYDMLIENAKLAPKQAQGKEREFEHSLASIPFYCTMSRIMIPNLLRANMNFHEAYASLYEARIALALMQHKRANGAYPDTLDVIAPALGGTVPQDPFSDKPFVYRKEGDGFTLYSVGMDFEDNQGEEKNRKDIVWRVPR